jgi:iron complex transport system ATP-binding protein
MTAPMLQIKNVSGGYRQADVVKNISLDVYHDDFLGLIGPNGSGKTTLLRLATKILTPRTGEISFEAKDISKMTLKEFCCRAAFVPQDITINFAFTVMEIVLMGRIPHLKRLQSETRQDIRIAETAMKLTDTLAFRNRSLDELSAGERQRVLITRALAQEPALLFLDEPTSHLDIGHQIQILDLLKKCNRQNHLTVVMILHDLNLASAYCNRVVLLENGAVFKEGPPQNVLTYQNVEAVYNTVVLVNVNPVTKRPNIILVPGEKT